MLRALDRAAELTGLGAGTVGVQDLPPGRLESLVRQGLTADVWALHRLPETRRTATLLATVRALQVTAIDDALDLFAVLMASKLLGPAQRAAVRDRLRTLPALRASVTLAAAVRAWLLLLADTEDTGGTGDAPFDVAAAWSRLQAAVPRERLAAAVATVEELAPDDDGDPDAGARGELVKRYATVRPFLPVLTAVLPLAATDAGRPVLAAVRGLA